jgi:hypothetical protein
VTVSDDRARPEYGEYATPEEQAKAAGLKYVRPEPVKPAEVEVAEEKEALPPRWPTDRYITLLFLIFGAISLIESVAGDLNFVAQLHDFAASVGVTSVQVPAAAQVAGYWLLAANVVLYGGTAVLTLFTLSRRRISFYIPIVGLIVYYIVYSIILNSVAPDVVQQVGRHLLGMAG